MIQDFIGSERSSPQVYTITFEILSQKIVSKKNDSLIRYLENKSLVNKRSVSKSPTTKPGEFGKFLGVISCSTVEVA